MGDRSGSPLPPQNLQGFKNLEGFVTRLVPMINFATMIAYPHAKINLGLNVVSKRDDGYHNVETVFYPVQWCDILEILPGPKHSKGIEVHLSGIPVAGKHADNLCVKAYELLRRHYPVRAVKLYLHKQIPMGAGLGGGSADAAFFVKKMNELFSLGISNEAMRALVMQLGADCAFFIDGTPVYAGERGDKFTPIDFSLKGYHVVIVYPGVHVATATAFANITPATPEFNCMDIVTKHPVANWKNLLSNDFERTVFKAHPEIAAVKDKLYASGALYASMTGSGSAVYGLFEGPPPAGPFEDPKIQHIRILEL
jgi:4-diphosphocytidyl-2-C-methyl-D-erythritol kinase